MSDAALVSRLILASVFAVAGLAKLRDRPGSVAALEDFGVRSRIANKGAIALPLVELTIALGLLVPATAWAAALAAAGLLAAFIAAIGFNLSRGERPECHCFGQLHSSPAGWPTLLRNVALLALGVVVVAAGRSDVPSPVSWVGGLSAASLVVELLLVGLASVAVVQGFFVIQLLRQNGRIIARLERLESGAPVVPEAGNGLVAAGLPVGAAAPEFALGSVGAGRVALADLLSGGRRALLVFSDPDCDACDALLPDLAAWQKEESALEVAVVASGGAEANAAKVEEHGLGTVLLQEARETAQAYRLNATPSAVAVSTSGRIASPSAQGPAAIRALKQQAEAWASPEGSVPAGGLPVGTEAPALDWPDLRGGSIALHDLRGKPLTLVFWDPACGFCQQLAHELRSWGQVGEDRDAGLIIVSRGSAEDNEALELDFPIVLDQGFAAGSAFGVTGTPSAVALDSQSRVASTAAVGAQAVMKLLRSQPAAKVPA